MPKDIQLARRIRGERAWARACCVFVVALELDGWFRFLPCYLVVMFWMCWSYFSGTWLLVSEIFWLALFLWDMLSVPCHLLLWLNSFSL
jgi:hypothetical protein